MYRKNYYSIRKARSAFESIAQSEKCIAQKNPSPCVTENGEFNAPSSSNAATEIIPASEHQHFYAQCNDSGVLISNKGQININCDEEGSYFCKFCYSASTLSGVVWGPTLLYIFEVFLKPSELIVAPWTGSYWTLFVWIKSINIFNNYNCEIINCSNIIVIWLTAASHYKSFRLSSFRVTVSLITVGHPLTFWCILKHIIDMERFVTSAASHFCKWFRSLKQEISVKTSLKFTFALYFLVAGIVTLANRDAVNETFCTHREATSTPSSIYYCVHSIYFIYVYSIWTGVFDLLTASIILTFASLEIGHLAHLRRWFICLISIIVVNTLFIAYGGLLLAINAMWKQVALVTVKIIFYALAILLIYCFDIRRGAQEDVLPMLGESNQLLINGSDYEPIPGDDEEVDTGC